jgi:ABC-type transport system involved in multi-copper enzyme maturation permease subunit
MTGAWRIARREYRAYLTTPWCYGLAVAFLLLTGIIFFLVADGSQEASLRFWFPNLAFVNLLTIPVITSRTIAEEKRTQHLDVLLTGPVSPAGIVVGKWLAVQALFMTMLAPTLVYVGFLIAWGNPDLPPIATAYCGAVLTAGFFAALGTMTSAFTVAPIAAGVASFAMLVTLQLGSGLPGLRVLSYVDRLDAFARGAPSLSDTVFFVTATAICLSVAASWQASRRETFSFTRLVTSGTAVGAFAGMNVLVVPHDPVIDFTANNAYTLSGPSKEALRNISGPASITLFEAANSNLAEDAGDLLARLRKQKPDLQTRVIDIARYQGEALRLGATDNGQAVVEMGTRRELVAPATELALVSALQRLSRRLPQTVCALTGHGERGIDDSSPRGYSVAKSAIEVNGIAVRSIDLTVHPVIPTECTILALLAPTAPLRDSEVAAVNKALRHNGKLIVTAEPGGPNLDAITVPWGLRQLPGIVFDPSRSVAGDPTTLVVNNFPSESPLSRDIQGVVMLTSGGVTTASSEARGLSVAPILATGTSGWLTQDPMRRKYDPKQGDRGGPVVLGGAADYSTISPTGENRVPSGGPKIDRTRLALFADADWAANGFIPEISNQTLLVNTINWLAGEEDLIAVGGVEPDLRRLTLTPARQQAMGIVSVGVLPFMALATGCLLWYRRRRV